MPILSSIAGAAAKAYGMMANAKRIITDTFNRANGSIGTSSSGYPWSVLSGTWSISSDKATSSDSGSTYPLATVDIGAQNVVVSADITDGGPGVAFWVTDANSWWASSVNYRTTSFSFTCCGGATGGTNVGCGETTILGCGSSFSSTTPTSCSSQVYYFQNTTCFQTVYYQRSGCGCYETGIQSGDVCVDNDTLQTLGPLCCTSATGSTDTGCGSATSSFTCCGNALQTSPNVGCGSVTFWQPTTSDIAYYQNTTCYGNNYHTELNLYKNVSGTISTVATQEINSNTSGYSEINSIKAVTSGDLITISGYTNAGLSSQLGSSLTNTPASPSKGTKAGIIKTPSDANSGSLIDNFSVENVL